MFKKVAIVSAIVVMTAMIAAMGLTVNPSAHAQSNRNTCTNNVVGVCAGVNADVLRNGQVCVGVLQYTASCQR
jgi:hypothetical protein